MVCLLQQNPYRVARAPKGATATTTQSVGRGGFRGQTRVCGARVLSAKVTRLLLFVPTSADPSITRERD